ncbi:hypothetical protein EVAR_91583_1 [Eumeta japonica]|uniref:Uncharacterized protein n=1 Tax=Eumeta variegata TaxID=151549 RepID=A0A4C1XD58_EUMVA|nr:hypothetical protein EVAR_91583_1 [Eumeta japonica]
MTSLGSPGNGIDRKMIYHHGQNMALPLRSISKIKVNDLEKTIMSTSKKKKTVGSLFGDNEEVLVIEYIDRVATVLGNLYVEQIKKRLRVCRIMFNVGFRSRYFKEMQYR